MYGGSYRRAESLMTSVRSATDEEARTEIASLEHKLAQQHLITQTLLALLLEKGVIAEEDFMGLLAEIDELDGIRDGALAEDKRPVACKACGKNNGHGKTKCMWCGRELELQSVIVRP